MSFMRITNIKPLSLQMQKNKVFECVPREVFHSQYIKVSHEWCALDWMLISLHASMAGNVFVLGITIKCTLETSEAFWLPSLQYFRYLRIHISPDIKKRFTDADCPLIRIVKILVYNITCHHLELLRNNLWSI